jgi:hypothetical protein
LLRCIFSTEQSLNICLYLAGDYFLAGFTGGIPLEFILILLGSFFAIMGFTGPEDNAGWFLFAASVFLGVLAPCAAAVVTNSENNMHGRMNSFFIAGSYFT